MIRFDRVTKLYPGNSRPALNSVDVEIRAGEFVFLVGASGSGKSSFLRLVLKEEKPSSGEIHVLGQRLSSISSRKIPYFRRSLGVVFQDFRLLPNRTVFQNVAFTLQVIGKSRGFIQEAVPDVLQMVGLDGKAERLPHELSGGEQQRVAIARAVVNKPAVLLADEPTGNLDPTTSQGIMQVLELINLSGTTVVMATHDVGIVDSMKRRVIELVGGNIVRDEVEGGYTTSLPVLEGPREDELVLAGAPAARRAEAAAPATGPARIVASHGALSTGPMRVHQPPRAIAMEVEAVLPDAVPSEAMPSETMPSESGPSESGSAESVRVESGPVEPGPVEPAPVGSASIAAEPVRVVWPSVIRAPTAADAVATGPVPVSRPEPSPKTTPVRIPSASRPEFLGMEAARAEAQLAEAAVSPIDETTSPRSELPLALRLRAAAGEGLDTPADSQSTGLPTDAEPRYGDDDALSLAVRLGLRDHGAEPEHTSAQEIGPTS